MLKNWVKLKKSKMSLCGYVATVAIACLSFLAACGGDSSSSADDNNLSEADMMVDVFDDLPVCTENRDGVMAYVKKEKIAYTCINGEWTPDSENNSSSSGVIPSSNSESNNTKDPDAVPTSLDGVKGYSQKGPFIKGSSVKVLELENGRTLKQTGRSFDTKIQTDDGHFKVNAITMVSQYLELHADGYYRNEVTGQNSSSPLTLYALTDVMMREGGKVNINLLTHLEYQRVLHLVQKQNLKVSAAKNQAQKEVLAILNIDGKGFGNSEDLNIVGTTDADGALLAFSILFQGNHSVADLTSLLQSVVSDLEEDGEWNDEESKAKIADWAAAKDLAGELATIRGNIERWNLGSVPDFEKHVRNFWYVNYGLGKCGTTNKAEVKATVNDYSSTYGTQVRYICKDGTWVEASDIEKDTYKWKAGEDGEIKIGDVTQSNKYIYDAKTKKWRDATTVEAALGGCTESREADISKNTGKVNGTWYICKSRVWKSTNNITVDTQGWIKGSDGDLQKGDNTDDIYKYDEAQKKWLTATHNDTTLKLMGCTTNRTGEIGQSTTNSVYYVCKNMDWREAEEIDYDTYGKKCTSTEVGMRIDGVVTATNKYYCTASGWISLMYDWNWDVPKEVRFNTSIPYGTFTETAERGGQTYKTVTIGEGEDAQTWMAENLNYYDETLDGRSWCYGAETSAATPNCAVAGRLYTWAAAVGKTEEECGYGKSCNLGEGKVQGICPDGWHLPKHYEWERLLTNVRNSEHGTNALQSQTGWRRDYEFDRGTDAFGFSALPAGLGTLVGNHGSSAGDATAFWSATEVYYMWFYYNGDGGGDGIRNYYGKDYIMYVRCLKD